VIHTHSENTNTKKKNSHDLWLWQLAAKEAVATLLPALVSLVFFFLAFFYLPVSRLRDLRYNRVSVILSAKRKSEKDDG